jgi:hypothetical protein
MIVPVAKVIAAATNATPQVAPTDKAMADVQSSNSACLMGFDLGALDSLGFCLSSTVKKLGSCFV